jgi:hypothetical protein
MPFAESLIRSKKTMPILINPMNESLPERQLPAPRLESLQAKRVVLLDISKPGGRIFLDSLERALLSRHGVAEVVRESKPTFAKPAPGEVMERVVAHRPDAVIEALAD